MPLIIRSYEIYFTNHFTIFINCFCKYPVLEMPWVQLIINSILIISVVKAFEDQFTAIFRMFVQEISDVDELVDLRVTMYNTTVPNRFAVQEYNQPVINVFYVDPILFFHITYIKSLKNCLLNNMYKSPKSAIGR